MGHGLLRRSSNPVASSSRCPAKNAVTNVAMPDDVAGYQTSTGSVRVRLLSVTLVVSTPTDAGPGAA